LVHSCIRLSKVTLTNEAIMSTLMVLPSQTRNISNHKGDRLHRLLQPIAAEVGVSCGGAAIGVA